MRGEEGEGVATRSNSAGSLEPKTAERDILLSCTTPGGGNHV